MKLRWWVVGMVAVAASSMFVFKHFADNRKAMPDVTGDSVEENYGKFLHETSEAEFDDVNIFA